MTPDRRRELFTHVLPAWLSAVCAVCALALTAYTLFVVHSTEGKVDTIMHNMGPPPAAR